MIWSVPEDPVERNLLGTKLERRGSEDRAIQCYEANVRDGFDGSHPYERLTVIFRRRKEYSREVTVLERAIEVFRVQPYGGSNVSRFSARLEKAKALAHGKSAGPPRPARREAVEGAGPYVCQTKGCGNTVSAPRRLYCDKCREIRAAPNAIREGDLLSEKLFFPVAGTRHHAGAACRVVRGEKLYLVRDPQNEYDCNAIEIRRSNGGLIGYVPRNGFLQGKWGHRPYTQRDLARALDAGAGYSLTCYATGGVVPGSVQAEGFCNGWLKPCPARAEIWAERGTVVNTPPEPLPFTVQRRPRDAIPTPPPEAEPTGAAPATQPPPPTAETAAKPNSDEKRPWWRRIFGG